MGFKKKFGAGTAVVASCGVVALLVTASPGVAAEELNYDNSGQISSTVRKSVSVTSDANGAVNNSIMVTQVSSVGKGQTTVNVPVNATSARNLDGFGGTTVNNKEAVFNLNLNGNQEERIMTSSGPGPIEITAEATLDGQPIKPSEVVNKTGVLKVKYTVVNTEKQVVDVATRDEKGNESTEQQEVDAPIGGSVAITLPQGFNEITAPGGTMGGNGQGGTNISYSLVMFKPLGDPVATVEYESRISNGTLPAAEFTMVPIVPMENSTIKTARSSFETGVQTGDKIADAGKQIGDGAGELGTGIATAADGASQLAEGLNGKLLPGANALAAGADKLASGITGTLQPGANELAAGINGTLKPGANQLADALAAGAKAAPELVDGAKAVNDGVQQLNAGVNTTIAPNPAPLKTIAALVAAGVLELKGNIDNTEIDDLKDGAELYEAGSAPAGVALGNLENACKAGPTPPLTCEALADGVAGLIAGGDLLAAGTITLTDLLISQRPSVAQLSQGATGVSDALNDKIGPGLAQLAAGTPALVEGAEGAVSGLEQAAAGAGQLADGINDKVAPGASQLADGINDTLAPGAGQLADGANQLADGVPAAADGASQLAAGLPAAVEGAGKLSDGGKQLEAQGQAAAGQFASQVNGIDAAQQLGVEGVGIPNGGKATGENVTTTGAYGITLQAAKTPEQNNGLRFGLAALALIIAGGAGTVIYRRRQGLSN